MSRIPDRILMAFETLKPFPAHVVEAMQLLDDLNTSAEEVASALGRDPVLAARVLRLANSALYLRARRVATLREAVVLVGFAAVRSLLVSAVAYDAFRPGAPGYGLDRVQLWQHSLAVATVARRLAGSRERDAEAAFVAGLLHDIGKLALSSALQEQYPAVLEAVAGGMDFVEAERAVLGCDHAQVGAEAARRWNLPDPLITAIAYHHRPDEPEDPGLADAVHVADALCLMLGVGVGTDQLLHRCSEGALRRLGLSADEIPLLLVGLADLLAEVASLASVDLA
ncbi:MAG: HDOD domain-containing protein [Armatimonadota bacterium]|nr:HDOD domain-containing protein [Armatimonadota bacterium]MDR7444892.1 HDOD domain-containing protein [Armatimonadota bacterium]MDR7569111.1 HDOD domain-containing protein [Armatimonadota bacterium]MDR7613443.1 HDOD domain-containing protein [Armatimonadota bacterium]